MRFHVIVATTVLSYLLVVTGVNGQQPAVRKVSPDKNKYDTVPLTVVPQLPLLPQYTGSEWKLRDSYYYPNARAGRGCFVINYLAKEKAQDVFDWYVAALQQSGWESDKPTGTSTGGGISARMPAQRLFIIVSIGKTSQAGYRSDVHLRYMDFGMLQN